MSISFIAKTLLTDSQTSIFYTTCYVGQSKRVFVFLHGLGGEQGAWDAIRQQLAAQGDSSVAIDLRGSGKSDRPRLLTDYALEQTARDVTEVIKKEQLKNVILVGHCYGGGGAQYCALEIGTLAGMVLVNATFKNPSIIELCKPLLLIVLKTLVALSSLKHCNRVIQYARYEGSGNLSVMRIASDICHTSRKSYFSLLYNGLMISLTSRLHAIGCPTLIISGTNDIFFPPHIARQLNVHIPRSKLVVVAGANHPYLFREKNRQILFEQLRSFKIN